MRKGLWVLKAIVMCIIMVGLVGFVTMHLWNWLVPVLFAGPVITFWQGLGLLLLSKIFLWSFAKSHWRGERHQGPWKYFWKQKLSKMSQEERDELKRKMRERWGC